jgi:ABC-type polar amino acid transport system ATPase subunit
MSRNAIDRAFRVFIAGGFYSPRELSRSRVGLCPGEELVVLDESFAALDPESLWQALNCVLGRARTLMVIAHP